jgi:hypothetical protein
MRSELVFRASDKVANRYLLCQATAKTTRCLHFASANTTDAITDAFVRMADSSSMEFQGAGIGFNHGTPAALREAPEVR